MALILQHPYKVFPWSFPLNQVLHLSNNRLRRRWSKRLKMVPTRSATPGVRIKLPWLGIAVPAWLSLAQRQGTSPSHCSLAAWPVGKIWWYTLGEKICHRSCLRTSESSISAWHVEILGASSSTTIYRCDVSTQPLPIWSMFFDVFWCLVDVGSIFCRTLHFCIKFLENPELLHQLLHQPLYWPCHSCMLLRVPFQFLCLNMFDMFFCCIYVMQQVLCRRHNIFVSTTSGSSNIHPPAVELGPPLWWLNGLMCAVVPSSNFLVISPMPLSWSSQINLGSSEP